MNTDKIEVTQQEDEAFEAMSKEWNGEGLPPVGVECELRYKHATNADWRKCKVFAYSNDYGAAAAVWHLDGETWHHHSINISEYEFRKPETQQQREERERLEAAYDLYCTQCKSQGVEPLRLNLFIDCGLTEAWLAIVDKTGYRKA